MSSPDLSKERPPVPHTQYYHTDIYQVGGYLFTIHRHVLRRESVVFDSMFTLPPPEAGQDGRTDSEPIVLEGVLLGEFEALLDYLNRGSRFNVEDISWSSQLEAPNSATNGPILQDYIDLLSAATRFECLTVRQHAINGIETLRDPPSPSHKIALADKFDIQQWLLPAYVELCKRNEPLQEDEAIRIGCQKTCLIAKAREIIRSSEETLSLVRSYYYESGWPFGVFDEKRVTRIVMDVFQWPGSAGRSSGERPIHIGP